MVEPADAELRLPPEVVVPPLRAVLLERLVVALEREVLLERLVLALEREVLLLERLVLALEREVLLERLVLALEREDELPELLIVPPIALEVDPLLRLTLEDEELRETLPEELLDELPEELLRDELVWLEDERLLPPLRDWALTGDIASAIAATAASASLNVVFIMLNFSVRKYSLSIWILHISYQLFISARIRDLSPTAE